jgi:hypothetical protein
MRTIVLILMVVASVIGLATANNEPKCNEPIERSAVTKDAAEAAAKVVRNPPIISSEIYSSKVKSESEILLL